MSMSALSVVVKGWFSWQLFIISAPWEVGLLISCHTLRGEQRIFHFYWKLHDNEMAPVV